MTIAAPVVAVLGAGQLGRMLGLAAIPMGVRCRFLDVPSPGGSPAQAVGEIVAAEFTDLNAIDQLATGADAGTLEWENVPAESVERLARHVSVSPSPHALRITQCRALEKRSFAECGVPTNRTIAWDPQTQPLEDLARAVESMGLPAVIKTQHNGYDGKFQSVVRSSADLARLPEAMTRFPLIVEEFVAFGRELSIIGARRPGGQIVFYPLVQNTHANGILQRTVAPAPEVGPEIEAQAQGYLQSLMEHMAYVGVMALELFEVGSGGDAKLLANEMAPRVHNSGHWTIEGARTSQFENHIRAVLDWPLGDASPVGHSVMVNLIGREVDRDRVLSIPGAALHWYGKTVRPGRKVGHVTVNAATALEANQLAQQVDAALEPRSWSARGR